MNKIKTRLPSTWGPKQFEDIHRKQLMCLDKKMLVDLIIKLEGYNEEWVQRCREITEQWEQTINDFKI